MNTQPNDEIWPPPPKRPADEPKPINFIKWRRRWPMLTDVWAKRCAVIAYLSFGTIFLVAFFLNLFHGGLLNAYLLVILVVNSAVWALIAIVAGALSFDTREGKLAIIAALILLLFGTALFYPVSQSPLTPTPCVSTHLDTSRGTRFWIGKSDDLHPHAITSSAGSNCTSISRKQIPILSVIMRCIARKAESECPRN